MRPARRATGVRVARVVVAAIGCATTVVPSEASLIDPVLRQPSAVAAAVVEPATFRDTGPPHADEASPFDVALEELSSPYVLRRAPALRTSSVGADLRATLETEPGDGRRRRSSDHDTLLLVGIGLVGVGLRRFTAL